jgi:polyhydroxyalkanoate synthesis regulator phasin
MEAMGKYCGGGPCSWSLDLGKATVHGTNAHNLFDEMSSQGEVSKEDPKDI